MITIPLPNHSELMMVAVPKDSCEYEIKYATSMNPLLLYCIGGGAGSQHLAETKLEYEILGIYYPTKENFFLENTDAAKNWMKEYLKTATDPLLSLLEAEAGKHWLAVNPICNSYPKGADDDVKREWAEYESRLMPEKILIILKRK